MSFRSRHIVARPARRDRNGLRFFLEGDCHRAFDRGRNRPRREFRRRQCLRCARETAAGRLAINWLPDIGGWAKVVATLLAPGGFLYLLEGHPAANVLDQKSPADPIVPTYDYFQGAAPLVFETPETYTEDGSTLANTVTHEWIHSLSSVIGGLIEAGLRIEWFHEHARLPWRLFPSMVRAEDGMYDMPAGSPNLPLLFSLKARKPA
jgi:hypothetical protein